MDADSYDRSDWRGIAVGATDELGTDQVKRMRGMMAANAGLLITTPAQNNTPHFMADWTTKDDVMGRAHHEELKTLLDTLADDYGFTDAS